MSSRCKHGIFLPKSPKYTAEDVCSICKGLPENKLQTALLNDDYTELSNEDLNAILADRQYDHTVTDCVQAEMQSRYNLQETNESE